MKYRKLLLLATCCSVPREVISFGPIDPVLSARQRVASSSTTRCMGLKTTIRIVGRKSGSESWLEDACSMYETRLKPANIDVQTEWHKNDQSLTKGVQSDYVRNVPVVMLDPRGKRFTSEQFTDDFYKWMEIGGSRMVFCIGGAEGLPADLRAPLSGPKPILVSLSNLTFTHQFARLVLIEQIYRASEIRKGTGYHK
jgi:23S rRNA (pseudouridine1915-N3)-methyltransferase